MEEIAGEKAGIIKKTVPVVSADQGPEASKVIMEASQAANSPLYTYGKDFSAFLKSADASGTCFDYVDGSVRLNDLFVPLSGEHQMKNSSVAIKAAGIFLDRRGGKDSLSTIHDRIRSGLASTKWPGRLELIHGEPSILIDGAHNPAAADALSETIKKVFLKKYKKIIMVLGIMSDKEIKGIMKPLLPLASEIIVTAPSYSRASSPEHLSDIAASLGFLNVRTAPTVKDALEIAVSCSALPDQDSSLVVVTGSFYTIGEAKEALGQTGILTRLREC